jgi:peptide-methionine (S)-S-oxide reductase
MKATFGAGCFWGVELEFSVVKGVTNTVVGYMGGILKSPSYAQVCSGKTGHAEVVQVIFDPEIVSYKQLLKIFWKIHDPTTLDRQGVDVGTQYRSVIFYHSQEQKSEAEASKKYFQKNFRKRIVTEIIKATVFTKAEKYHQKYLKKKGSARC